MNTTLVGKLYRGNPFIASVLLNSRSGLVALAIGATVVTLPQIGLAQNGTAQNSPPAAKTATPLARWSFDPTTNKLEVTLPEGSTPRYFLMAQPARIILDLPNTAIGTVTTQKTYPGAVRQIRVSQFQPGVTRFVLELAKDTVLAPEQVQLQQVGNASAKRWVLRPVIASAAPMSRPVSRRPLASPAVPSPAASAPTNASPTAIVSSPTPVPRPLVAPSIAAPQIDNVPPDQGISINVPPPAITPSIRTLPRTTRVPIVFPTPNSPDAALTPPPSLSPLASPPPSGETPDITANVDTPVLGLPPAEFSPNQAVTVSVPTLGAPTFSAPMVATPARSPVPVPVAQPALSSVNAAPPTLMLPDSALALPPAKFEANSAITVKVPALPSTPTPSIQPTSAPRGPLVEFGQPLPGGQVPAPLAAPRSAVPPIQVPTITAMSTARSADPSPVAAVPPTPEAQILLPSGTLLNLRYPGSSALNLRVGTPLQEVLLLQAEVRDRTGKVIPEGTPVLGRFESNNGGSRFIAQAITLQGRNVPLVAQSDPIDGGAQISQDSLLLGSGLGALALGAIGGFTGLNALGGAAVGAAVSYATAPRPATLQPGQVLQVRLLEALR